MPDLFSLPMGGGCVSDPARAPCRAGVIHAHPDGPSDIPGRTWRDRVVDLNRANTAETGLLTAGALYTPAAYASLIRFVGSERLYILSAGWGLVRADFRLPDYDITFSASADAHRRRRRTQAFADFNHLAGQPAEDTLFLGGKDYLPLFLRLTASVPGRRGLYYNAATPPHAPGCAVWRYVTPQRTNWHYRCAADIVRGALHPRYG